MRVLHVLGEPSKACPPVASAKLALLVLGLQKAQVPANYALEASSDTRVKASASIAPSVSFKIRRGRLFASIALQENIRTILAGKTVHPVKAAHFQAERGLTFVRIANKAIFNQARAAPFAIFADPVAIMPLNASLSVHPASQDIFKVLVAGQHVFHVMRGRMRP